MTQDEEKADRQRHDHIIKKVFEYPEMVRGFFEQHLPDDVKEVIALDSIKTTKETFIEEALRSKACDILFEAKLKNSQNSKDAYIYLIVEGQSSNDPLMAFRLLKYMTQICDRHLKLYGDKAKDKGKLPLVYPMIFWQNEGKYQAKRCIWDLFPYPDMARKAWSDDCQLINVQEIPDSILAHNIWTGLFQIVSKYIYKPQILLQKLDEYGPLLKQLDKNPLGQNYNINIVYYVLTAIVKPDKIKVVDILNKYTNKGEQIMGSIAQDFIEQGINQGINIGIDKGKAEGRVEGKAEGINLGMDKQKRQIAKKLIYKNRPLDEIAEVTGLSLDEVKLLSKQ
jgi:predicted transposase/invertase (TIGR01784 family)